MGEALGKTIDGVKGGLTADIERLETKIDDGFERMEQLLTAPNTGLIPRVKRVEETVGIRPGE